DYRIQILLSELFKRRNNRKQIEDSVIMELPENLGSSEIFDYIKNEVKNIIHKLYEENESKPKKYLNMELMRVFHSELSGSIKMFEYGNPVYSSELKNIFKPLLTNNAVYIDTPMAFNSYNENHPYWEDLNSFLKIYNTTEDSSSEQISSIISDEILFANVELERDLFGDDKIIYKRKLDDLELELSDCATGIKSLSLILLLIKNGTINNQTLLILDEPETHLHPQWVVEYARVLVLLREKIGCRIFISSHSPDMVQAIKLFSEKHNMENQTLFYLANQESSTKKFKYLKLDNNISEIFKCFNKSLDKINEYYENQILTR
ncbi:AAA family ATPase, partial [Rodentibacter trehalosifermentans]|uniref:AAA family ATPase n=1 Tax=Rodentibacter trehalosifermentans TaxID=1908263 RepID=UPI000985D88A